MRATRVLFELIVAEDEGSAKFSPSVYNVSKHQSWAIVYINRFAPSQKCNFRRYKKYKKKAKGVKNIDTKKIRDLHILIEMY